MRASPITRSAERGPGIPIRIKMRSVPMPRFSRRAFLLGMSGLAFAQTSPDKVPVCEDVRPEASGIRWVHDNGASPEHYLPETMGPGCAFLDYDNDGRMDIYLVNSGPSDFYKPAKPIRNA